MPSVLVFSAFWSYINGSYKSTPPHSQTTGTSPLDAMKDLHLPLVGNTDAVKPPTAVLEETRTMR
ncbi:hypothetical protein P3T76_009654 [Phytophthora citrophthora]|uniref:Uncharacterized protein n=1 Tax=Phytophthora citrophthora TaxID=4793 RepID=A0AAD9GG68_9STRA|nr:hypothetical protein P3T76_009654 [Phytophthora citrophthora]